MPLTVVLPGGMHATHVGLGYATSYAVGDHGHLYAWGNNVRGQLGSGSIEPAATFEPTETMLESGSGIVPLTGVSAVFRADGSHQCAQRSGSASSEPDYVCWGGNDYGELGYGTLPTPGEEFAAARVASALPPRGDRLAFGEDHGCLVVPRDVTVAGDYDDVWCWGRKEFVGDGTVADPSQPSSAQLEAERVRWPLPSP
jgi:alpha-tubulin suppressor-like RCC1 family protein